MLLQVALRVVTSSARVVAIKVICVDPGYTILIVSCIAHSTVELTYIKQAWNAKLHMACNAQLREKILSS